MSTISTRSANVATSKVAVTSGTKTAFTNKLQSNTTQISPKISPHNIQFKSNSIPNTNNIKSNMISSLNTSSNVQYQLPLSPSNTVNNSVSNNNQIVDLSIKAKLRQLSLKGSSLTTSVHNINNDLIAHIKSITTKDQILTVTTSHSQVITLHGRYEYIYNVTKSKLPLLIPIWIQNEDTLQNPLYLKDAIIPVTISWSHINNNFNSSKTITLQYKALCTIKESNNINYGKEEIAKNYYLYIPAYFDNTLMLPLAFLTGEIEGNLTVTFNTDIILSEIIPVLSNANIAEDDYDTQNKSKFNNIPEIEIQDQLIKKMLEATSISQYDSLNNNIDNKTECSMGVCEIPHFKNENLNDSSECIFDNSTTEGSLSPFCVLSSKHKSNKDILHINQKDNDNISSESDSQQNLQSQKVAIVTDNPQVKTINSSESAKDIDQVSS